MTDNRVTTLRRNIEQIVHCAQEALSALNANEDPRHIRDDLNQAKELISFVSRGLDVMVRAKGLT